MKLFITITLMLLLFSYFVLKKIKIDNFENFKPKIGIIMVTNNKNIFYLNNTIKKYIEFSNYPLQFVIFNYDTNSDINLLIQKKNIEYINNLSDNKSILWNAGIEILLNKKCESIIISKDTLSLNESINKIIVSSLNNNKLKYYIPICNIDTENSNQNINNYNKGIKEDNSSINDIFIIFSKSSLIANKINNQYFKTNIYKSEIDWQKRFFKMNGKGFCNTECLIYNYNNMFNNEHCIYSINIGNYEGNKLVFNNSNNKYQCDFIYFIDNIELLSQCIKNNIIPFYLKKTNKPIILQRMIKTLPHRWLPLHYNISIYIDSNVRFDKNKLNCKQIINKFLNRNTDIACWYHWRKGSETSGIYNEHKVIINHKLSKKKNINKIQKLMKKDNFIDNVGLTETNVLIRRHHNIKKFSLVWSKFIYICHRDQASFDYLIKKFKVKCKKFPFLLKPTYTVKHVNPINRTLS